METGRPVFTWAQIPRGVGGCTPSTFLNRKILFMSTPSTFSVFNFLAKNGQLQPPLQQWVNVKLRSHVAYVQRCRNGGDRGDISPPTFGTEGCIQQISPPTSEKKYSCERLILSAIKCQINVQDAKAFTSLRSASRTYIFSRSKLETQPIKSGKTKVATTVRSARRA